MAVVNVQNRVASAQGQLPAEVVKGGVTIRKTQNSNLKFITLYSPDGRYDAKFLTNYLKINVEPRLARIAGVGEVNVFGADVRIRNSRGQRCQFLPIDCKTLFYAVIAFVFCNHLLK